MVLGPQRRSPRLTPAYYATIGVGFVTATVSAAVLSRKFPLLTSFAVGMVVMYVNGFRSASFWGLPLAAGLAYALMMARPAIRRRRVAQIIRWLTGILAAVVLWSLVVYVLSRLTAAREAY